MRLRDSQVLLIPAVFDREMFLKLIVVIAIEQAEGNLAKRTLLALVEFDLAIAQNAFDPGRGLASPQIRRAQDPRPAGAFRGLREQAGEKFASFAGLVITYLGQPNPLTEEPVI